MASSKRNYDVFLSFRGKDVRNNFLSHLYADLDRNGIHTFKDSEELRKGEEISPTLMMAIEESRVAIVIFSEDYASSRWCLEELVKIMECKAQKDVIVLPVFYKVEPREVRRVIKGYGRAMAMHESDVRKDPEIVKRWKKALSDAGSLSGWDYNNEDEEEFIRGIVKQVSSYLERTTPLYVAKYPVGLSSRVQEVISLLQKKSYGDDVLMIGIWGPGGIGKTTIARAIYNAIKRQFEGSSFLDRVRETSNKCNGLVELQEKILSQILSPRHLTVYSEGRGSSLIRGKLCHKKVLLVLDDVDDRCQLDMLAGGGDWFGKGSRIFVTSRDKHVLTSHGINHVYETEPLDHVEALDLFNQHAFPNCQKPKIRKDLIDRALHYASGLPLALEVVGSLLSGWSNDLFPEFGSGLKKLVGLDIQKSHIRLFDSKLKNFECLKYIFSQNFECLKYIDFSQWKSLVSVPDLSSIPNLESLNLDGCESLVEVHQSIAYHDKLKILSLKFCSNLSIFAHTLKTKSLQALDLFGCSKLEKFSHIPEKMEHLEELDLGLTAIKELPASIENLPFVKIINLEGCKRLATLPLSVYKLENLEQLDLVGCSNFVKFPKNLEDSNNPNGGFRKLKILELDGCNLSEVDFLESSPSFPKLSYLGLSRNKVTHLPTCINKYKYLQHLYVDKCKQLQKIPQLPPNVHVLSTNCCRSLQEFPDLSSLSSDCCWVRLSSCRKLSRKGANLAHALSLEKLPKMRNVDILLIGREMPEWFFHCKDGSISFTVPRDLYDKFLGLALCFVLGPEGGKVVNVFCDVRILVNGRTACGFARGVHSMEFDHVWIKYFPCNELGIVQKRLRDDCRHFEVKFVPETGARLKKCGFRPICEQQEDDLRIVHQTPQPMETNCPLEESDSEEDNWTHTEEEESSGETDDELIEAIDQEREKQGLFKANKIGPLEERDSGEDNWINTEEEESSSETDDEAIDPEKERQELFEADKIDARGDYECDATLDLCRSLRTLTMKQFSRKKIGRY